MVFDDPIAIPLLGERHGEELRHAPPQPESRFSVAMRAFLVARSRYAEECLKRAVGEGVRQYVLLRAGLDTFGYRNPYPKLRVFEVDHPATQTWKHELLQQSGIRIPENVTFAPVDFETQSLPAQLAGAGFDFERSAFFAWLGVVPYLTMEAFRATIAFIADRPLR